MVSDDGTIVKFTYPLKTDDLDPQTGKQRIHQAFKSDIWVPLRSLAGDSRLSLNKVTSKTLPREYEHLFQTD